MDKIKFLFYAKRSQILLDFFCPKSRYAQNSSTIRQNHEVSGSIIL